MCTFVLCMRGVYIVLSAGPRPLMNIDTPSMTVEKRLDNHSDVERYTCVKQDGSDICDLPGLHEVGCAQRSNKSGRVQLFGP
jgi:hypothetical protein